MMLEYTERLVSLAEGLTVGEVQCKCGCGFAAVNVKMLNVWEALRKAVNKPIRSFRWSSCAKHNAKVGGAPSSGHIVGMAFDPDIRDLNLNDVEVRNLCAEIGFTGIGWSKAQAHLDVKERGRGRMNPLLWNYTPNGIVYLN